MRPEIFPTAMIASMAMLFSPALAQAETIQDQLDDSPRHLEFIDVPVEGSESIAAFIAYPERSDAAESIVIIHDIRAMTPYVRRVADRLAENGYLAIVPDLLSGKGPGGGNTDSFENGGDILRAVRTLESDEVTARLRACVKHVRALPSTNDTVSVAGFCFGGSQTFRYVTNDDSIKAAYVFYGSPPEDDALARIACPVYGFYGENDNRINSTIEATKTKMAALDKAYDPLIYNGVGHGFVGPGTEPDAAETLKARTEEAWARWLELLGR